MANDRYFLYRNIAKAKDGYVYSMRSKEDGKVKGHTSEAILTDVKFKVSGAGRNRVRSEGVKNVHAGVEGNLYDGKMRGPWVPITYDPKKHEGFIRRDTGEPVTEAKAVKMTRDGVMMKSAFWQGFSKAASASKGEMREVSKVAVVRDGKLLMGRRRDTGKWTEPGGHLNNGESPLMGAARELQEETGIKADPHDFDHLASKLVKKPDGSQILVHAYLLHSDVKLPTTMKGDPDEEVQRWHWVDIAHPRNEEKVLSNMHVPMKYNIVFRGLGLTEEP